jgi:hypothetical protein
MNWDVITCIAFPFELLPWHTGSPTFPFNCQVLNQTDHSLFVICVFDTEKSSNVSWNSNHLFPAKWQEKTKILVHPRTHYVCEVYHLTSSHLLANVTTVITELPNYSSFPYVGSSGSRRSPEGMKTCLDFHRIQSCCPASLVTLVFWSSQKQWRSST